MGVAPTPDERPLSFAGFPERAALRIVQLGAIAVVLASSALNVFDLDRFFIPKELALHVAAVIAGLLAIRAIRRTAVTRIDLLLIGYLVLSVISALFATNRWLAFRALAVSASAMALFWVARGLRQAGMERPLFDALALAIAIAAITSLVQAYGLETPLFSLNRAPGGTLGNRNFVGHAAAFGLPLMLLAALAARRRFAVAATGFAIVVAALVLTRSRAAWLAAAAVALIFIAGIVVSPSLRRHGATWRRLLAMIVVAAIATGAALLLPNALHWRGENPYLESMRGVVSYDEGSGRGRLVQWGHSLRMSLFHPLFGVGPGNWPVTYPRYAPSGDRSMNPSDPGMTYNPWPSSDWIAFVAERGVVATALLALAIAGIVLAALRRIAVHGREPGDVENALEGLTLVAVVVAAAIAGMFDAVLLLPLPAYIVWAAAGTLWAAENTGLEAQTRVSVPQRSFIRGVAVAGVIVIAGAAAAHSAAQLVAMETYATHSDRASLERAARLDPGNYRLRLRLARIERKRQLRCEHALAARSLFPSSEAARSAARGCGE